MGQKITRQSLMPLGDAADTQIMLMSMGTIAVESLL